MYFDKMPTGNSRRYVSQSQIEKIKKGGKIADQIKKERETHHSSIEIPQAEEELMNELEKIQAKEEKKLKAEKEKKKSIWQIIILFFKKLWIEEKK